MTKQRFTENDFLKIVELLSLTKTITLDVDKNEPYEDDDAAGSVLFELTDPNDEYYYGSMHPFCSYGMTDLNEWLRDRVKIFQDSGSLTLEVKYVLNVPSYSEDEAECKQWARFVYGLSHLSEVITFDDFFEDLEAEADWVNECFGAGGETSGLLVDAVKVGSELALGYVPARDNFEQLLNEPIVVSHNGAAVEVYIGYWQD